jgi:outer membrane protein TolC
MKAIPIFLFFNLWWAFSLHAGDTLTVGQVRALALQTSPLQQKKALAESVAALQLRNIRSNNLPRIQVGAQATWQSEVFGFPVDNPAFNIPEVPKDQYKLAVDASQRLWDGGSDRYQRRQRELERDITATQTDVDVFQLREIVTDLYFNALLLQENEAVLAASLENLQNRLRQTEAAVAGGVALRTNADQIRIQILQTQQQIANARANQQSLKSILAVWIGRQDTDFQLQTPNAELPTSNFKLSRPEHRLFDLQYSQLQLAQDMLRLKTQPRVELFAQGGFGRPNPFNFFETGFEPFAIFGVRALWTPIDWGNRDRDRQVLTLAGPKYRCPTPGLRPAPRSRYPERPRRPGESPGTTGTGRCHHCLTGRHCAPRRSPGAKRRDDHHRLSGPTQPAHASAPDPQNARNTGIPGTGDAQC